LGISLTKSALLIARSKDEWNIPGQNSVYDRISHCPAEANIENRAIDLWIRIERLWRPFYGSNRPHDNRADASESWPSDLLGLRSGERKRDRAVDAVGLDRESCPVPN
jgi:hypothetical protein